MLVWFSSTAPSPWRSLVVPLLVGLLPVASTQLTGSGLSVVLNGIPYYISPFTAGDAGVQSSSSLSAASSTYGFTPVTVVRETVAESELSAVLSNYSAIDDVFQDGFASVILSPSIAASSWNSSTAPRVLTLDSVSEVPSGPYFMETSSGALHQVYRLYDDFAGAFSTPLLQTPNGTFQPLSAQVAASATMTVGVPSRLYFTKTAEKPLAGVRFGVKDIFQLAGAKSSYGNRAYYKLYPESNVTGTAIQRLIDAGAIIVGLQKPSQFANGEEATADWVDYHAPFNPRGDGYQDPSSSSSGAGASVASYEWLDVAVGSDTGGSIRGPSQVQGLFGNRPSHGLVSLDHVMPLSEHLDTPGFLTRDPYLWDVAQSVMYDTNYTSFGTSDRDDVSVKYPTTIYTVEWPTDASASDADALLVGFVNKLAGFIGGNVTSLDLEEAWAASNVTGAPGGVDLDTYLNTTYPMLIGGEQIELVKEPFFADYAAVHDGRVPFVDPAPLARWEWAASQPSDALGQAIANKTVFMDWLNSEILPPTDDASQCSSSLLLYWTGAYQNPRNQYYGAAPTPPFGFTVSRLSPFGEVPDSVFPVGQVRMYSEVTQHDEWFPLAVDVVAAKGCDGLLVKLAQDLVGAGIVPVPQVGQTIYGGDVLMKRRAEGGNVARV